MKANQRVTALEILEAVQAENNLTGFKVGEEVVEVGDVFGKVRVRVGGLPVNDKSHLIFIQPATDELDVVVGNERYKLNTKENLETRSVSDVAQPVVEANGKKAVEASKALQAAKKAAKENTTEEVVETEKTVISENEVVKK